MKLRKRVEIKNWEDNLHVMKKVDSLGLDVGDIRKVYYITEQKRTPTSKLHTNKMVTFQMSKTSITAGLRYSLC